MAYDPERLQTGSEPRQKNDPEILVSAQKAQYSFLFQMMIRSQVLLAIFRENGFVHQGLSGENFGILKDLDDSDQVQKRGNDQQ